MLESKTSITTVVTNNSPLITYEKLQGTSNYKSWAASVKLWFKGQSYSDHLTKKETEILAEERLAWKPEALNRDKFMEEFIKWSLLPLTFPINPDTMKLLKDDYRKIVLTIMEDEANYESTQFIKLLKAAASANHEFIFAYVGFKQWQDFAECFEVNKKTPSPKMVVWDGAERYFSVIGSESIHKGDDQKTQITLFLEGFREGRVVEKDFGPSLLTYIGSLIGTKTAFVIVSLVVVVMLIVWKLGKDEPLGAGYREHVDLATSDSSSSLVESGTEKED